MVIKGRNLPYEDLNTLNYVSNEMEVQALKAKTGWLWGPEPAFTYPSPMVRPDGFMVRRKSFQQYKI